MKETPIHILIAEDDEDDRLFFREFLKELPFDANLTVAADGDLLINLIESYEEDSIPDIIFLDINMPKKSGLECVRAIRNDNRFQQVPLIILSTSLSDNDINIAYDLGANMYVKKACFYTSQNCSVKGILQRRDFQYLLKVPREKFICRPK